MKNVFLIALLFLSSFVFAKEEMQTIFKTQLAGAKNTALLLERPTSWDDPGDFTKVTLMKKNKKVFEQDNMQAIKFSGRLVFPESAQILGENFAYLMPSGTKSKLQLLVYQNWTGGSSPDSLIFVDINSKKPKIIMNQSHYFSEIRDYNSDGLFDLLVEGGNGEPSSSNRFSYSPYLVYQQSVKNNKISFKLNTELSKKWSEENNFQWHGPEYDSKIVVNHKGELVKN